MKDNLRKYKLAINNTRSFGAGTSGTTVTHSLLNGFTIEDTIDNLDVEVLSGELASSLDPYTVYGYDVYDVYDCTSTSDGVFNTSNIPIGGTNLGSTVTCNYPKLTKQQLGQLNVLEFEKRVCDFLKYVGIEDGECRTKLVEESSYYDPAYEFRCKLNSDFLVYSFFDGVRVINVGEATGVLQYKAYPFGEDASGYTWTTNPTFLGLSSAGIYVFEVRDYYDHEELCKVTKTIPLDTLVQSTTVIPKDVQVYLGNGRSTQYLDTTWYSGSISISPTLSLGEKVCVGLQLGAESSANGTSYVEIYCCEGGVCPNLKICGVDNDGISPINASLIAQPSDVITYQLYMKNSSPGDCSSVYLKLTGVDGLSTTNPTIDVGRCCASLNESIPMTDITIYLQENYSTICENCGEIKIAPIIPSGKYIDIEISSDAFGYLGGTAEVKLTCCTSASPYWSSVLTSTHLNPQPTVTTVRMCSGDKLNYKLTANATAPGSCAGSCIELTNSVSSSGVDSYIDYQYNMENIVSRILPTTATVSICRQTLNSSDDCQTASGYINVSPSLSGTQNVLIDVTSLVLCMNYGESKACTKIYCKPNGSSSFTQIMSFNPVDYTTSTNRQTGAIVYRAGDQMCYTLYAQALCAGNTAQADIVLNNVVGYNGVDAYLNGTVTKQYDEVYGILLDPYGSITQEPIGIGNIC